MKAQQVIVLSQITIEAKPSEVFIYLSDLNYYHLWNPQMESISPAKRLKLGMVYHTVIQMLGLRVPTTHEVTKLVPPKILELQSKSGLVQHRTSFTLTPQGANTQLVCKTEVSADRVAFAFATPALKLLARRELKTDMQSLKLAVEHKLKEPLL